MKEKICDRVYRVVHPLPYDLQMVNCYLIEEEDGYTMIDTSDYLEASCGIWQQMLDKPLKKIVLTHAHADHFGITPWLVETYGAQVVMSKKGYEEYLYRKAMFDDDGVFQDRMYLFLNDYILWSDTGAGNAYNNVKAYSFEPDILFEPGDELELGGLLFKAIWTPGHSPDHFCFYNEELKLLFAGDHILEEINPIVLPSEHLYNPLESYLASFDYLQTLDIEHALPGHLSLIENFKDRVGRLRRRYETRWAQILEAMDGEPLFAEEITSRLYPHATGEQFAAAAMQTITNLIYLESQGIIKKQPTDTYYRFYKEKTK
ncbi:MAG: MBL fold metallo-hydrolase [Lysinibacillus sp.]